GNDYAHRPAVLDRKWLSLPTMCQEHVRFFEHRALHVRGVAVIGMEDDVLRFRLRPGEFQNMFGGNPAPMIIVTAPLRDAVNIGEKILLRLRRELGQRPDNWMLDKTVDL